MDEGRPGLVAADRLALRVIPERPDVAMGLEPAVGVEPRRAPAESGDPVPLEALGERPQGVDPERRVGDHVLLAHGAMINGRG